MKPVIIVNFKTYPQATGEKAVALAKLCEAVGNAKDVDMRVAVQPTDIHAVSKAVSIPVYAEHVDPINAGRHTGFLTPEAAAAAGAVGTLLNHSEHRFLDIEELGLAVQKAKESSLAVIICAATPEEGSEYGRLDPEFIAVEPPELIGGDTSVSTAQPEIISGSVEKCSAALLIGAGVKTGEDVKIALDLGAKGVLLASGVTKAEDPKAALEKLLDF